MGTVPTFDSWTAGENPTAAKMTSNIKTAGDFFKNPPLVHAVCTGAGLSLTSGTAAMVPFNGTDILDTDSMHDPSTNNTRIVCQTAGVYDVTVAIGFASNATGVRQTSVRKNAAGNPAGGSLLFEGRMVAQSGGFSSDVYCGGMVRLSVGDYLEVAALQTSGGALAVTVADYFTFFMARWVAA